METIASRLRLFLKHKNLGTSAFTRQLKYKSCEKIARLFRLDNAKPSVNVIADIAARYSELSIRWLLTGEGAMLRHTAATRSATQPENILRAEALESLLLQSRMEEPDVTHHISIAENI